jgi:tRNA modification GTPase
LKPQDILDSGSTIVAPATAPGVAAIAVIRVSGPEAFAICNKIFKAKDLSKQASHTVHFGTIRDEGKIIDEVLLTLFKGPHSFTKEDVVEISCHGSDFIVKRIIQLLLKHGARLARAGEFTQRAFLNGQFDLAQAEAIADLISSDSDASHQAAIHQMRGGFSEQIKSLRERLISFAALIELELDFSEEDVEFANRQDLKNLVNDILALVNNLITSFDWGNVIKNGVPTVIVGKPNAGKSTLLNRLLNEEKAIVSEIAGTTRDYIEDELVLEGITFRFIDTAGLRETLDTVEAIGVQRTQQKMKQASLILYLFDVNETTAKELSETLQQLKEQYDVPIYPVANKIDSAQEAHVRTFDNFDSITFISAARDLQIDRLKEKLLDTVKQGQFKKGDTVVTNLRHFESLTKSRNALEEVLTGLDRNMSGDFLAMDIRTALYHLGEITGEITTEDLLGDIFSKFCIGK